MIFEAVASRAYCPDLLVPAAQGYLLDLCRGLYGHRIDLRNPREVQSSLDRFVTTANQEGVVDAIARSHIKPEQPIPDGTFELSKPFPLRPHGEDRSVTLNELALVKDNRENDAYVYSDGPYGFALGLRIAPTKVRWIAGTSFIDGTRITQYNNKKNLSESAPVVIQLQIVERRGWSSEFVGPDVTKAVRWEKVLLSLVEGWAQSVAIPATYVLPSEMNRYKNSIYSERFKLRYDVTASRTGYKKNSEGFWRKDLEPRE